MQLYDEMKNKVHDLTHSQYVIHLLDAIFATPIFRTTDFVNRSQIPKTAALPMLRKLRENNILVTMQEASGRRPAVLAFRELLNKAEGKVIF